MVALLMLTYLKKAQQISNFSAEKFRTVSLAKKFGAVENNILVDTIVNLKDLMVNLSIIRATNSYCSSKMNKYPYYKKLTSFSLQKCFNFILFINHARIQLFFVILFSDERRCTMFPWGFSVLSKQARR